MNHNSFPKKFAFTLLELLIVVVLLGILAAVVIPQFIDQGDLAEQTAVFHSMKSIASSMIRYKAANGDYPPDKNPAQCPVGFAEYVQLDWVNARPLGGKWDWDKGVFGITAGISVYLPTESTSFMQEMDRRFDDGNLSTGAFRARSQGYIYIIEY